MERDPDEKASNWLGIWVEGRPGLIILAVFVAVLSSVVWLVRARQTTMPEGLGLTLICFAFGWAYLSIWKVVRAGRKLGWNRSNYAQFLSDLRTGDPGDPDELLIGRWTLQLCFAVLAVMLCVLAFELTG